MRWFVEVSHVGGGTPAERYCVEAKAWQAALQETRKLRGDSGPLSKFSIELLDDGYRAVDPVQKIRYLVNQAPSGTPVALPPVNGAAHAAPSTMASGGSTPAPSAVSTPSSSIAQQSTQASSPEGALSQSTASSVPPARAVGSVMPSAAGAVPMTATPSAPPVGAVASMAPADAGSASASAPPGNGVAQTGGPPRPSPRASSRAPAPAKASASAAPAPYQPPAALPVAVESVPPEAAVPAEARVPVATAVPSVQGPPDVAEPLAPMHQPEAFAPPLAAPVAPSQPPPDAPAVSASAPFPIAPTAAAQVDAQLAAVAPIAPVEPAPAPVLQEKAVDRGVAGEGVSPSTPFELVTSRTQEPTPETPIFYCEVVYAIAPGSTRQAVELFLKDRFAALKAQFVTRPSGQLLQIAVFDHVFDQRPKGPPLGTLAWKDWRGEPVLGFPAFPDVIAPPSMAQPAPAQAVDTAATAQSAASSATESAVVASAVTPLPLQAEGQTPSPAETRPVAANGSEAAGMPKLEIVKPAAPDRDSRMRGARRKPGEDLISELFELMHELHFARDIATGAEFVLRVLDEVIPCDAVILQVFDINTRNFVVVRARGAGTERAIMLRTPDTDPLTVEIMRRDRSRKYSPREDTRFKNGRWGLVAAPLAEALCGPVRQDGRYLGTIELANPLGGTPFHDSEINALDYICEQFADFVASRPIVLDADVILARA